MYSVYELLFEVGCDCVCVYEFMCVAIVHMCMHKYYT